MEGLGQLRHPDDVTQVVEAAKAAQHAQQLADALQAQASTAIDPAEKETLLARAREAAADARRKSRKAHRLASGTWQGAAGGAGIGAAVGAGLGTLVGTLVGTIASIPTTGLGVLVGIPAGWIHGPWVGADGTRGKGKKEGGGEKEKEGEGDEDRLREETLGDEELDEEAHRAVLDAVANMDRQQTGLKQADLDEGRR